jgi:hypothetical protein
MGFTGRREGKKIIGLFFLSSRLPVQMGRYAEKKRWTAGRLASKKRPGFGVEASA